MNGLPIIRLRSPVGNSLLILAWVALVVFLPVIAADAKSEILLHAENLLWLKLVYVFVGVTSWQLASVLTDGRRVLATSPLPRTLWITWRHAVLRESTAIWLLLCICSTVLLFATPSPLWRWTTGASSISVVMTGFTVAILALRGFFHRGWFWVIFAVTLVLSLAFGVSESIEQFGRMPIWLHVAGILSWPLLIADLSVTVPASPAYLTQAQKRHARPTIVVTRFLRRYNTVDSDLTGWFSSGSRPRRTSMVHFQGTIVFVALAPNLLHARWGDQISVLHILAVLFFGLVFSQTLLCRDLHWRRLLAPKGPRPGSLGWQIARSTVEIYICVLTVLVISGVLAVWSTGLVSLARCIEVVLSYRAVGAELIFVVCVGLILASLRWWLLFFFLTLAGTCVAVFFTHPEWILATPASRGFTIHLGYVAILLLASGALIFLGNRAWTPQKLQR